MYTWTNKEENEAWEANYTEYCKYKWTIEKWIKINGSWKRTDIYRRFDTLEDARQYALKDLKKIA